MESRELQRGREIKLEIEMEREREKLHRVPQGFQLNSGQHMCEKAA